VKQSREWTAERQGTGFGSLVAESVNFSVGGCRVLSDISLRIANDEVVGLLGRDGSGKTCLFELLAGLAAPTSGQILLNGADVTGRPADDRGRRGLCYLPEEPNIFRDLTVEENIRLALDLAEPNEATKSVRLEELLKTFRLRSVREQSATTLSGGERRRCEVARALAARPAILMLDEPFRGLDPMSVAEVASAVQLLKEQHIGVLISDYDLHDLIGLIDRAYLLHEGRVIFSGTPGQLLDDPGVRHLYLGESFAL
jgi:lipopolysaccharide export system ATP-binding protein